MKIVQVQVGEEDGEGEGEEEEEEIDIEKMSEEDETSSSEEESDDEDYQSQSVKELKEILKQMNLNTKGRKADLVNRIKECQAIEQNGGTTVTADTTVIILNYTKMIVYFMVVDYDYLVNFEVGDLVSTDNFYIKDYYIHNKMIKKSEIINKIHIVVYLYLVFGWLFSLTSCKILLFFSPTVMAQWGINNDRCILTQLEEKYRKEELMNIKILKKDDDKMVIKDEKEEKGKRR